MADRGECGQWGTEDLRFLLHIVDEVTEHVETDRNRVNIIGFSGGGRLAYQMAAEHSDRVAALFSLAQAPVDVVVWKNIDPETGVAVIRAVQLALGHEWQAWNITSDMFDFFGLP